MNPSSPEKYYTHKGANHVQFDRVEIIRKEPPSIKMGGTMLCSSTTFQRQVVSVDFFESNKPSRSQNTSPKSAINMSQNCSTTSVSMQQELLRIPTVDNRWGEKRRSRHDETILDCHQRGRPTDAGDPSKPSPRDSLSPMVTKRPPAPLACKEEAQLRERGRRRSTPESSSSEPLSRYASSSSSSSVQIPIRCRSLSPAPHVLDRTTEELTSSTTSLPLLDVADDTDVRQSPLAPSSRQCYR